MGRLAKYLLKKILACVLPMVWGDSWVCLQVLRSDWYPGSRHQIQTDLWPALEHIIHDCACGWPFSSVGVGHGPWRL